MRNNFVIALIGFIVGAVVAICSMMVGWNLRADSMAEVSPGPYEVLDKYESGEHFYIKIWLEVPMIEYIGLDVGDEYEVRK